MVDMIWVGGARIWYASNGLSSAITSHAIEYHIISQTHITDRNRTRVIP